MANPEHVDILKQGVEVWNTWIIEDLDEKPDLSRADLSGRNLRGVDFSDSDLSEVNLSRADLSDAILIRAYVIRADLSETILRRANLNRSNLFKTDLNGADLRNARLFDADLRMTNLKSANLSGAFLNDANLNDADLSKSTIAEADLYSATLVRANVAGLTISDTNVYGVSAWGLQNLERIKEQKNLRVTPSDEPAICVDNLEVAQFVYLLLHNEKIRSVIDTIGEKGVLILGRFTPERKAVLDAIRDKLRGLGFVPMMFDFEKPTQRDFTETIKTLAGMSRFIIADITNPKSAPLELQATMPDYMIPFVPIIQQGEDPFSMFVDLQNKYEWVLEVREYPNSDALLDRMEAAIVRPALEKSEDMLMKRASGIRKRRIEEWQYDIG